MRYFLRPHITRNPEARRWRGGGAVSEVPTGSRLNARNIFNKMGPALQNGRTKPGITAHPSVFSCASGSVPNRFVAETGAKEEDSTGLLQAIEPHHGVVQAALERPLRLAGQAHNAQGRFPAFPFEGSEGPVVKALVDETKWSMAKEAKGWPHERPQFVGKTRGMAQ